MNRWCRGWIAALGLLVASACTDEEDPDGGVTCQPFCGSPVQTGDGGSVSGGTGGGVPGNTGGGVPGATGGALPGTSGGTVGGTGGAPGSLPGGGLPGGAMDSGVIVPVSDAGTGGTGGAPGAGGEGGVSSDAGASDGGAGGTPGQTLPPVTDYSKPGPYKTTTQANVGPGSNYTIFRPDPLGANGFLHAPIIFGPGILTDASMYTNLLQHLATHGFVSICVNSMWGGPGDPGNLSDMKMGLDWLIAQNTQAGTFQGKLAVDRAAAMGYSIGATAAVELASHNALKTVVAVHGHQAQGDPRGPALLITGTSDVIGSVRMTLATLEEAPAVLVALPIGHLDVLTELAMLQSISSSTRYIAPITGWLRYWIYGDQDAKKFFWGSSCEMCKSPWIPPESNAKWKAQTL